MEEAEKATRETGKPPKFDDDIYLSFYLSFYL
jgi:hypothetical protein